ncbi:GRP family sugar transporter, partial [Bacillus thuringiensis]|uniref:GRP family sugar transporter n=1 Tax=Bacillus thuringiensis TaxID=1428 RepID=UPI00283FE543
ILRSLQSAEEKNAEQSANFKRGIPILFISTVCSLVYVVVFILFNVDGWSALLPLAFDMLLGGILITFKHQTFNKYAIRIIL